MLDLPCLTVCAADSTSLLIYLPSHADRNLYTIRPLPFTDVRSIRRHNPPFGWQYVIIVLGSGKLVLCRNWHIERHIETYSWFDIQFDLFFVYDALDMSINVFHTEVCYASDKWIRQQLLSPFKCFKCMWAQMLTYVWLVVKYFKPALFTSIPTHLVFKYLQRYQNSQDSRKC